MTEEDDKPKGVTIFGRNIADIPCFRDSYFYGICTGLFGGFGYFMATSKVRPATNFGMAAFAVSTLSYWTYCRYDYSRKEKEAIALRLYMLEKIAEEAREGNKVPEITTV